MSYPPPTKTDGLPEYYLGMIYYYDAESDDNCRWCVYYNRNIVRCYTRREALQFIQGVMSDIKSGYATELQLALIYARQLQKSLTSVKSIAPYRHVAIIEKIDLAIKAGLEELQHLFDEGMATMSERAAKKKTENE